ncbi:MAG: DNA polymerase III subunit delta [Bifidobacteriaceae bacterium]|jgi:DNA polymerase-3 subunit delta|nr:DNA polymerase III subunit delta [Bifidobacteriaceae bacterium]MCI1978162.1 DNA polymerase III subunit delta [Bifidobacteriaceae bacterium]
MTRAQSSAAQAAFTVFFGGNEFLNSRSLKDMQKACIAQRPDAEVMELEAGQTDPYEFDEAVSPSLLSTSAVVVLNNLQDVSEELADSLLRFVKEQPVATEDSSVVLASHDGSVKGRKYVTALKKAGAVQVNVDKLKYESDQEKFVQREFARYGRRIQQPAVKRLVEVLGSRPAEIAAMSQQLCFDFDENPITTRTVMQYLDETPEVTGFAVADAAVDGNTADAVLKLRQAIKRGVEPLALIGAIASKLRSMGKAAALQSGRVSADEMHMNSWVLKNATRQVRGWSSEGLGACIEALAHADQEAKSTSGDPAFALEQAVELISRKGVPLISH